MKANTGNTAVTHAAITFPLANSVHGGRSIRLINALLVTAALGLVAACSGSPGSVAAPAASARDMSGAFPPEASATLAREDGMPVMPTIALAAGGQGDGAASTALERELGTASDGGYFAHPGQ